MNYVQLIKKILKNDPKNIKFLYKSLPNTLKYIYYEYSPYSLLISKKIIFSPPRYFVNNERKYDRSPEFRDIDLNNFRRT